MATIYGSSASDYSDQGNISNIGNANGAPDGVSATISTLLPESEQDIRWVCDLSGITITTGLSVAVRASSSGGTGQAQVGNVRLCNAEENGIALVTLNDDIGGTLGDISADFSAESLATVQATRYITFGFVDTEGGQTVSIDSLTITYTEPEASDDYSPRISAAKLSVEKLATDRLSLSRLQ